MLFGVSTGVNFVALLAAFWLGLYLITRSRRSPAAILTALALWAAAGYFLNAFLALHPPAAPGAEMSAWLYRVMLFWPPNVFEMGWKGWLQGWFPAYAVAFWYHATLYFADGENRRARLGKAGVGYLFAFAGIILTARYRPEWMDLAADPLYTSGLRVPLFPIFFAAYLVLLLLSTNNLWQSARAAQGGSQRAQFRLFLLASLVVGAAGILEITGWLLKIAFPQVITAVLLAAAVLLAGAGIARVSALREGRPFQPDFLYSGAGAGVIALVYLAALWGLSSLFPISAFVFAGVGFLAVSTHAVIDAARMRLDLLQFRSNGRPAVEAQAVSASGFETDAERPRSKGSNPEVEITPHLVEQALRHLHDYQYLSELPLARLCAVQLYRDQNAADAGSSTHLQQGKALAKMLVGVVDTLKPSTAEPGGAPSRSWYPYLILRDAYLECIPNQEIMNRLFISEGTFNRTRRAAVASVTVALKEMRENDSLIPHK